MPTLERTNLYQDVWSRTCMKMAAGRMPRHRRGDPQEGSARNLERVMGRPPGSLLAKPLPDGKIITDQTIRLEAIDNRIQFNPSSPP